MITDKIFLFSKYFPTPAVDPKFHMFYMPCFIFSMFIIMLSIIFSISLYTLGERKLMAAAQRRVGPNVQGYHGLLQPFADGLKLMLKEIVIPYKANYFIFYLAPVLFLTLALSLWALIPFDESSLLVDVEFSLLVIFMLSSLSVYGVIFSGWASNSVYAFLGALRSAAQMISYEISIGFVFLSITLLTGSLNLYQISIYQRYGPWLVFALLPLFIIFFVSTLAETNRAPFDLPESESELVAGYNVEYSSIMFAMFFLGEYSNMMLMSALMVSLFLGAGGSGDYGCLDSVVHIFFMTLKIIVLLMLLVIVRAALPRYRYDQLMAIGWQNFLPLTYSYFIFLIGVLFYFKGLVFLI